jgi:uncharacterized LabA/DUF88 family protein
MPTRVVVLLDGGNTRVLARAAGKTYNPAYIAQVANSCVDYSDDESLLRVLYYDCAPFNGVLKLPVSGKQTVFSASDGWLHELARQDDFAIRLGVLKFRGFRPKKIPLSPQTLQDSDFKPIFEQKGVDMRIGLDIAIFAEKRSVDRIILASQDTDCIPAMKHARRAGLQVVLVRFPNSQIAPELLEHADEDRLVNWPNEP